MIEEGRGWYFLAVVDSAREDVDAVEHQLPSARWPGIEGVHAVEGAQERRLAAARRADEGRHWPSGMARA